MEVADDGVGWHGGSRGSRPRANLGLELVGTLEREDTRGKLRFKRGRRGTQAIVGLPRWLERWEAEQGKMTFWRHGRNCVSPQDCL